MVAAEAALEEGPTNSTDVAKMLAPPTPGVPDVTPPAAGGATTARAGVPAVEEAGDVCRARSPPSAPDISGDVSRLPPSALTALPGGDPAADLSGVDVSDTGESAICPDAASLAVDRLLTGPPVAGACTANAGVAETAAVARAGVEGTAAAAEVDVAGPPGLNGSHRIAGVMASLPAAAAMTSPCLFTAATAAEVASTVGLRCVAGVEAGAGGGGGGDIRAPPAAAVRAAVGAKGDIRLTAAAAADGFRDAVGDVNP